MEVIRLDAVKKMYSLGAVRVHALNGINLHITKREFVAVLGPSGCGKSTLLNMIGMLDIPTEGEVFIDGKNTKDFSGSEMARIRGNKIGFVFQFFNLHPALTALENVELPGIIIEKPSTKRAKELLKMVGMEDRMYHLPSQLSGGQRQRVAIARSLMNHPSVILADEPTGNLDSKSGQQIFDILSKLNKETGVTVVVISHDKYVIKYSRRILTMKDGKIVKDKGGKLK